MMRNKFIAAIVTSLLTFGFVPAAVAHRLEIFHGNDSLRVSSDHKAITVSDNECDGNSVWGEYRVLTNDGRIITRKNSDYNGCRSGSESHYLTYAKQILTVRLCEDAVRYNCTSWWST